MSVVRGLRAWRKGRVMGFFYVLITFREITNHASWKRASHHLMTLLAHVS